MEAISAVRLPKPCRGDITRVDADVVINSADSRLLDLSGRSAALHRAAGASVREACRELQALCPWRRRSDRRS